MHLVVHICLVQVAEIRGQKEVAGGAGKGVSLDVHVESVTIKAEALRRVREI